MLLKYQFPNLCWLVWRKLWAQNMHSKKKKFSENSTLQRAKCSGHGPANYWNTFLSPSLCIHLAQWECCVNPFASFFGICFCISLYRARWSRNLQAVQSNLNLLLFFWKCLYVVVKISFWQSLFWVCSQQKNAFCKLIIAWWLEHSAEEERIQVQLANPNQTG